MPERAIVARSLALVGPGRAGRAFARSWTRAGGSIQAVVVRAGGALPSELSRSTRFEIDGPDLPPTDLVVLAVPDDAIGGVSETLAARLPCRFAFHLSGALPSDVLAPFRRRGASTASLHPLKAFTGAPEETWGDAFVAVEGEAGAGELGMELARALGARPHRLGAEAKPLYHAAASLAAGGVAAVVSMAVRAWEAVGIPEDVARGALAGLAASAVGAVSERPFAEALTGAVARRDLGTVRSHAAALASRPDALELYRALAEEILSRTAGRGKEDEIRRILRGGESVGGGSRPGGA